MSYRKFERIHFESRAMIKTRGESFEAVTENLSVTGLLLRTERRLTVGNRAEIMFILPSASRSSVFTVNGVVIRYDVHGMAFQFGSLDQDSFTRLKTVINRKSPNRLKLDYAA